MIRDFLNVIGSIVLFCLVVFVIVVYCVAIAKRIDWLKAHCEVIGRVSASNGIGNTFTDGKVGIGTVYIPGKTTYKCDDGVIYTE